MAPNIQESQVCEFHYDSQTLLTSINTKLAGLIWVIGAGVTVFALPAMAYVVSLEKRMSSVETQLVRVIAQRNADHPAKDKLQ